MLTWTLPSQPNTTTAAINEDSPPFRRETVELDLVREARNMPDEEWINTLEDGRNVKFIYQELPDDGAFLTAQLAGNEVVYSVVLTKAKNPLSREDVESHFEGELSRKQRHSICDSISICEAKNSSQAPPINKELLD